MPLHGLKFRISKREKTHIAVVIVVREERARTQNICYASCRFRTASKVPSHDLLRVTLGQEEQHANI